MTPTPKRAPNPLVLAGHLERTAKMLRQHGRRALEIAPCLEGRGFPSGTMGDGGSRSSDPTSIVERIALNDSGPDFEGINQALQQRMYYSWKITLKLQELIDVVMAHGDDADPLPAGSGDCVACGAVVRSDPAKPHHRIVAGFCPTCHKAYKREEATSGGTVDRVEFAHRRMEQTKLRDRKAS